MEGSTQHFSEKDAFAAYSIPGSRGYTVLWSDFGRLQDGHQRVSTPAFVVQTFDNHGKDPLLIPADHIEDDLTFHFSPKASTQLRSTQIDHYLKMTGETITAIKHDDFAKVVLSKIKVLQRDNEDLFELFRSLVATYRSAFVFLYHIPGEGLWCGATPEILLQDVDHSYHTMALAGTQPASDIPNKEVRWREKERHEQELIETFIEGKLDDVALRYSKKGPRTLRAGNVFHICTDYFIEKRIGGLSLASHLHPGPAICGMPQGGAKDWIRAHESHAREHYCGYIGPWQMPARKNVKRKESALFINLRSMSIWQNAFVLYVGGGLTTGSDAREEWKETELKSKTMTQVIAGIPQL